MCLACEIFEKGIIRERDIIERKKSHEGSLWLLLYGF